MINNISFAGKSIYLDGVRVIKDDKKHHMVQDDVLHMDKARLLAASEHFLSTDKKTIDHGFTTVKPNVSTVYTVMAPELGPNDDKLMISETEYFDEALATEVHELSRDDFKDAPEYVKIFNALRDAIIKSSEKEEAKAETVETFKSVYKKLDYTV
ncbi:MAG: hypothetical protein AB1782_15430 [Cyanobacteriota bacterium]